MDPRFEQASHFLDQAIIAYAAGQIEEASQHMANAAATLQVIELVAAGSAEPATAPEAVRVKLKAVTVVDLSSLSPTAVSAEAAGETALASAA